MLDSWLWKFRKLYLGIWSLFSEAVTIEYCTFVGCINKEKDNRPSFLQIMNWFGRDDWTSGILTFLLLIVSAKSSVVGNSVHSKLC